MAEINNKGRVCVTGGTGFLGSWMVKRLLEHGYYVNTTTRIDPERKRDISYLTNLPGASERLQIFEADLDRPDSFAPAIQGCIGVFHVAQPLDFEEKEPEEVKIKRVTNGTIDILQACVDTKTVRRVVYTSSVSTVAFNEKATGSEMIDESSWTDVDFLRSLRAFGGVYMVTKTLTEKIALDFAEKHGLDLVTVLTIDKLHEFLSHRYPEYELPTMESLKDLIPVTVPGLSSKKLLETGFKYENGLGEMFDGAIKSCKEMGLL